MGSKVNGTLIVDWEVSNYVFKYQSLGLECFWLGEDSDNNILTAAFHLP